MLHLSFTLNNNWTRKTKLVWNCNNKKPKQKQVLFCCLQFASINQNNNRKTDAISIYFQHEISIRNVNVLFSWNAPPTVLHSANEFWSNQFSRNEKGHNVHNVKKTLEFQMSNLRPYRANWMKINTLFSIREKRRSIRLNVSP